MRIVIDLQGAQSTSRNRGIGRYSLALAQSLVRNRGEHEILLALNGLFPETIGLIRAAFRSLLPQKNIRVWMVPGPVTFLDPANNARRDAAEFIREAFLASLDPDIVLITSLIDGVGDNVVTSIGRFANLPTSVILYDLIPLTHRRFYLSNSTIERWYMEKIEYLKRADLLLAISASSGREAVEHLGFEQNNVINISTACNSCFQPHPVTNETQRRLQSAYGINYPFVMYTGAAIEPRKNIEGLIRAYSRLPALLRSIHQLVIVCEAPKSERERLLQLAGAAGLAHGELLLTGYVPDEDLIMLYNACKLFIFPSWYEGFGLPALEAMQCGKAVIASNNSSLPEVIGRTDILFNPYDETDIAAKLYQVLNNENLRKELEQHGLEQSRQFNWDITAKRALDAMIILYNNRRTSSTSSSLEQCEHNNRLRLAYILSLPPENNKIDCYNAELLRELAFWYEVEVVIDHYSVADDWITKNYIVRDLIWFRTNHRCYDRVFYHIGNLPIHRTLFDLMASIPGIVTLHDLFLSDVYPHCQVNGWTLPTCLQMLQTNHGYKALLENHPSSDVMYSYSCNLQVLQQAVGIIVHSEYSRVLLKNSYDEAFSPALKVLPLLRTPVNTVSREAARETLGLNTEDFLICSFGSLTPTNLNYRIVNAFAQSSLAVDPTVHLVFVGDNDKGIYGKQLLDSIHRNGLKSRIRITGWSNTDFYRQYLEAADLVVQLQIHSHEEALEIVLDCMNYGLATIVNAHGSLSELDPEAVWMLPDSFEDAELTAALTSLWHNTERRYMLGMKAQDIIRTKHSPVVCAAKYAYAIENFYQKAQQGSLGLLHYFADHPLNGVEDALLARELAINFPPQPRRRQMLVDISTLVQVDAESGIQRVTRSVLRKWLLHPPEGWSIEPVYAIPDIQGYRYARRFTSRFLGINEAWAVDSPMDAWAGDVFVGLDLAAHLVPKQEPFLSDLRNRGVTVMFVIYDLLPLLRPDWWPDGMNPVFTEWMRTIARISDSLICISQETLVDLRNWLNSEQPQRYQPLRLGYFYLGSDIENSPLRMGQANDFNRILQNLKVRPTFLMVGTIEPRKGYAQTLAAFERLWARGHDINLVIVGKQGWKMEPLAKQLQHHTETRRRLFWLQNINDVYLTRIYASSTCLIAASLAEGFGLPLIEAARHKLPIIARDIPVFREVTGENAFYFKGDKPEELAEAIKQWISLQSQGKEPKSDNMQCLTWLQSAKTLEAMLMEENHPQWIQTWQPGRRWCLRASDPRFHSQVGQRSPEGVHSRGIAGYLLYGPYIQVPAGDYELSLYGCAGPQGLDGAEVDVCIERGEIILAKSPLQSDGLDIIPCGQNRELVRFVFQNERLASDLEIRVWTSEISMFTITRVEFSPVKVTKTM